MATTSSKTSFVLSMPPTFSAMDVVEKGKAQGILLTKGYVHTIRSKARVATPKGSLATTDNRSRAPARQSNQSAQGSLQDRFVDLVLELGLVRAEAVFSNLRRTVSEAIG